MSLTEDRVPALTIEPMRFEDWPAVHRIYAAGIATGDATLEREPPDWNHFDHSHPRECRFVARDGGWRRGHRLDDARWLFGAKGLRGRRLGERLRGGRGPPPRRRSRSSGSADPASEAAGYWTLLAGVMHENVPSLALHEAVGFRRVGVQQGLGRDAPWPLA